MFLHPHMLRSRFASWLHVSTGTDGGDGTELMLRFAGFNCDWELQQLLVVTAICALLQGVGQRYVKL